MWTTSFKNELEKLALTDKFLFRTSVKANTAATIEGLKSLLSHYTFQFKKSKKQQAEAEALQHLAKKFYTAAVERGYKE